MNKTDLLVPYDVLITRQNYPLELKVDMTNNRIKEWYKRYTGNVYVAFSGGRDSTVLLHLVRKLFPEVPAVFVNTGLEYPEIVDFVKTIDNVIELRPKMTFKQVIEKHGYPIISKMVASLLRRVKSPGTSEKHRNKTLYGDERGSYGKLPKKWHYLIGSPFKVSEKCCEILKINPVMKYHKETNRASYVGTMASDSNKRMKDYQEHGCYVTHTVIPRCIPLAFWQTKDVIEYIRTYDLPHSTIYDTGVNHTGCIFCCFGIHLENRPNRFDLMKVTHPKLYKYCMEKLGLKTVLEFIGIKAEYEHLPLSDEALVTLQKKPAQMKKDKKNGPKRKHTRSSANRATKRI
jgi:3'-phosphoadenosine 5'-phosphosulfate sulfotransferase (PAPS reductase)/FAD synthetase